MRETDSVVVLQRIVQRIRMTDPAFHLQNRELLDVLWLAHAMSGRTHESSTEAESTESMDAPSTTPLSAQRDGAPVVSTPATMHRAEHPEETPPAPPDILPPIEDSYVSPDAAMYTAPAASTEPKTRGISTLPLRAPGTAGLPDSLRIARALRPLMRRMPSHTATLIDEAGTAERIAYEGIPVPVWKPAVSRWLNMALLVDRGGAMHIWSKPVAELRAVFERHGAFGSVRAWNIVHDADELEIRPWSRRSRPVKPLELVDPTGRQLMVVVSDCVADSWSDGRMAKLLAAWGAHSPVVLLNVLPDRMWSRTALRYAAPTLLRATAPAMPSNTLLAYSDDPMLPVDADEVVKVPVATLDSGSLSEIAHLVAATGGATARGVALLTDVPAAEIKRMKRRKYELRSAPATERLQYFENRASHGARQLARLFAAAPYPLVEPVMRLIQRTILHETDPAAIAEVLLVGGLMQRIDGGDDSPERTRYDFTDATLREALLEDANRADLIDVLTTDVSHYVGQHFGETIDFGALIRDPSAIGELEIPETQRPFALIGAAVLRRLGGRYREIGTELLRRVEERADRKQPEPELPDNNRAALFRSWMNTPRRRRVELAAYLGDPDACRLTGRPERTIDSLVSWVDGLAEFGLPVLLYATLVATDGTHFSRSSEPLDKATEALREWANGGALKLRTTNAERTHRPQATIAAMIFSAWRRDKSVAEETRRRVEHVLYEARRYTAIDVLSGSIRRALLADILRDDSVVPDALSERATILFAGAVGDASEQHKLVAAVLGRKLAVRGYRLMTSDPSLLASIVSMSFATELEAFGHVPLRRLIAAYEWDSESMRRADAIVLLGVDSAPELLASAIELQKPVLPLLSAPAGQLIEYSHARVAHFLSQDDDDAELATDGLIAALDVAVGPEAGVAAWRAYSASMAAFTRACDRHAEPDAYTLALQQHCVHTQKARLEDVIRDVPHRAQWLAYDYVNFASSPLVPRARSDAFAILATLVQHHAQSDTFRLLGKRFAEVAALPPSRSIEHLPAAARAISGNRDITEWTHTLTGLSVDECEFRASIPLTAYWAARRYIAARPASHESDDADALRRALRGMVRPESQWLRPYFQSQDPAVRVVGYMITRLHDGGIGGAEWGQQLLTEVRIAVATSESRPLWQMLLATSGVIERADSSVKRILARALRSVLSVLQPTPTVDRAGECKRYLQKMLDETLANTTQQIEFIRLVAIRYGRQLSETILEELEPHAFSGAELRTLYASGGSAAVFAVRLTSHVADPAALALLGETLVEGRSQIELSIALRCAEEVQPLLLPVELGELYSALQRGKKKNPGLSDGFESALAKIFTLIKTAARPRARIAILGNATTESPSYILQFCAALGRELAHYDFSIAVANPILAMWLIEDRSVRKLLQRFVMFRGMKDKTPPPGMTAHPVAGDSASVHRALIASADAVVIIGGDQQTIDAYTQARQRLIPIVPVRGTGGAAADIARLTIELLENENIPAPLLRTLSRRIPDALVAAAAARVAIAAMNRHAAKATTPLDVMPTADLIAEVRKGFTEPGLIDHIGRVLDTAHWTNWSIDIRSARDITRQIRQLIHAGSSPWLIELAARCEYVRLIAEIIEIAYKAPSVEWLAGLARSAMNYHSLAAVSGPVLLQLRDTLKMYANGLPKPWVTIMLPKITEELKRRGLR